MATGKSAYNLPLYEARLWKKFLYRNSCVIWHGEWMRSGGIFDLDGKRHQLSEIQQKLENPDIWKTPDQARELGQAGARLKSVVRTFEDLDNSLRDVGDLLDLAMQEQDEGMIEALATDVREYAKGVHDLEFQRMFCGRFDAGDAFVDIQAGSGGTEAQDWAEMLLRMYLRWGEKRGYDTELIAASAGEVAGIKSATVKYAGDYCYGWLRTETGVHRLVRKSPFDSGNRRHTSFASVVVSPVVNDEIEIKIDPSDLRVDVYRASGAGGQHVNKTESAVRLTHLPSGVVTQCQNSRSQHKNKEMAMRQLRAKLYQLEEQRRREDERKSAGEKADIGWGSQIRSYVLDQSRIKDLRTQVESSAPQNVLDGDLDDFLEASLKADL